MFANEGLAYYEDELPNNFGGEKRQRLDDDLAMQAEQAVQDALAPMEEPEEFKPRLLPSRKRERQLFGKHRPGIDKCFFCATEDDHDTAVPFDDVQLIRDFIRDRLGFMDYCELADQVIIAYDRLRARVNKNLLPGEKPLPPMLQSTVLRHIRCHTNDAETKLKIMATELQELREEILDTVLEKSNKGRKRAHKANLDCLKTVIQTELLVQGRDPAKMWGYSAGKYVNPEAQKQGIVSTHTKDLREYFAAAARRR